MTINIIFTIFVITQSYFIYLSYKDGKYIKNLQKENAELQKLLALPKHLQFNTINKSHKNHAKRTKTI